LHLSIEVEFGLAFITFGALLISVMTDRNARNWSPCVTELLAETQCRLCRSINVFYSRRSGDVDLLVLSATMDALPDPLSSREMTHLF